MRRGQEKLVRSAVVTPTGVERLLGEDELIVSKTDTKGIITYANDVFCRMAAIPEPELLGQPHNIIRHPDMPRAVFKLLWDTLEAGREIFAYVVNLAADGAHYWVLAHVTPTFDRDRRIIGHHSNRRCPSRQAIEAVTPVYAALRAEEQRHARPSAGLEASTRLMGEVLPSTRSATTSSSGR
jgi:PAS domain S-box-containing protein